jgi:2-polyprenyl-3-methyl-5-hydroxy-6-metoxy-1,4-benzoquinol methylase
MNHVCCSPSQYNCRAVCTTNKNTFGQLDDFVGRDIKRAHLMDKSLLVRCFGFPATLIHGDTLVLDRWKWLKQRLPITHNGEKLIDIGCGTGAFTIGAARRGYHALGLTWDDRDRSEAIRRAQMCRASTARFAICDVRNLHDKSEYYDGFDVAICAENVEHILNDFKLIKDISNCLKPGGRLLLTTPNYYYRAISSNDNGPFCRTETGWHVRRGYTTGMLTELCRSAGLLCEEISYCSGFCSQKVTALMRLGSKLRPLIGWGLVLPLRPLIPLVDPLTTMILRWPCFSICLEAYKPRFGIG